VAMSLWNTNYKRLWAQERENWNLRGGRCVEGNQKAIGNSTDFYRALRDIIIKRNGFLLVLFFFLYLFFNYFGFLSWNRDYYLLLFFFSNAKFYEVSSDLYTGEYEIRNESSRVMYIVLLELVIYNITLNFKTNFFF
jgi:hypothetical protein